ncbi:hypothetical protein JJ691_100950 [Kutzneria sp. CA-103260]|nr:hypothetical protein JJ691_100950 [Kutzneria sp. CA-103260]
MRAPSNERVIRLRSAAEVNEAVDQYLVQGFEVCGATDGRLILALGSRRVVIVRADGHGLRSIG